MNRTTKLLVTLGAVAGTVGLAGAGWAYFTSSGTGTASAAVGTLNPPTGVTVPETSTGTVTVSWTASVASPPAVAPTGYYVERLSGATPSAACGTDSTLVSGTSCDDTAVADGTYTYRLTAVFRSWTAVAVDESGSVIVSNQADTTTSVVSSVNPSVVGQQVTYTATVAVTSPGTGTPTGFVEFSDGGVAIGSCGGTSGQVLSGASATCDVSYAASGSHTITVRYLGDPNYSASTSPSILQVVNSAPTSTSLTVTPSSVTYGDEETVTFTSEVTPVGTTGSVTVKAGATIICAMTLPATTCAPSSSTDLNAGSTAYVITAVYSGDDNFTTSTSNPQELTVSKAPLTITASGGSMTYGGTVPSITASYAGFVNSQTSAALTTQPVCSTTATSTSTVAGSPYPSSCSGAAAENYTITYTPGSITVTRAPLTITASGGSMTYGGTVPSITASYTGLVNSQTSAALTTQPVCSTTATSTSTVAGSPYPSSCSGAAADNYSITYANGSLTVTRAVLTVTANSASKTYGAANPPLTSATTGFVNSDPPSVVTGTAALTTTAVPGSNVGSYPITPTLGTLAAANYTFTFANGTLTVNKASLTVTASNGSMALGGTVPTITASYAGSVIGETASVLDTLPTCPTTATSSDAADCYTSSCTGPQTPTTASPT